jgi:hypothetical protein
MNLVKKAICGGCLAFFSISVNAYPWSGSVEITQVYPYADGLIFITPYTNTEVSTCDGGRRFSISKSHPNYDVMVSTMLAAFVGGKRISFYINSGQNTCAPTINRFFMAK